MRRLKYAALPYTAYALVFILAPILLIAYYSFTSDGAFTLEHFAKFFDPNNTVYMRVLVRSIYIAVISTVICFLLGYPMAYILSRMRPKVRTIASVLFILPMWMNFLLRTYAWMTLLERTGVINTFLNSIGLSPINIMYTQGAIVLGNVYNFLPFMILPIYNVLIKVDHSLVEAAQDLGAGSFRVFTRVTFPMSLPGVFSGISMTFMPAVTTFIVSRLLGGGQNALIGDLIETQFNQSDWGFGSALSMVMMVLILIMMAFLSKYEKQTAEGGMLL